jgi:putative protein kinase ArgK-like GTPase of G3E family
VAVAPEQTRWVFYLNAKDAFGDRDHAKTLHSLVPRDDPPRTIGLFGPWAVGKSTILDGLGTRLDGEVGQSAANCLGLVSVSGSYPRQFVHHCRVCWP